MTQEHFEVQHYTLVDGWINCWTDIDENGEESPSRYDSAKIALFYLDDLFDEIEAEFVAGIRDTKYSDSEYRIVKVVDGVVTDIYPYQWLRKAEDQ